MLDDLPTEFRSIARTRNVPLGDFPEPGAFRQAVLAHCSKDLSEFPPLNPRMLSDLNDILSSYIPRLMATHNKITKAREDAHKGGGGAGGVDNPFGDPVRPLGRGDESVPWAISSDEFTAALAKFELLGPVGGKLNGNKVRPTLLESGLPLDTLRLVWDLADIDADGFLDGAEFAVALYLVRLVKGGDTLPKALPADLVPPSKR